MRQKGIMRVPAWRWGAAMVVCLCMQALSGCSIGPLTMERDRLDYQMALSESWKRQVLLNLVRLRYADAPVFLEVTSIITQYSAGTQLNAGASLTNPPWSHSQNISGSMGYSDKPTLTYMPLTGEKFARSLFAPIPPATVISLVQAGWPVDVVLGLTCSSINGIRNQSRTPAMMRPANPKFEELLATLRRIQLDDSIATRAEKKGTVETAFVIIGKSATKEGQADRARARELLQLDPDAMEFRLVYGAISSGKTELALQTRSMSQLLVELASYIEVPRDHVTAGRTYTTPDCKDARPLLHIYSGATKPRHAFAEVQYRGCWYWVADGDFASKRMLSVMMMFFSLVETGSGAGAPVVTVQAG